MTVSRSSTCSGVLGDDGELSGHVDDAVAEAGAVCRHEATVDRIHVELERAACRHTTQPRSTYIHIQGHSDNKTYPIILTPK